MSYTTYRGVPVSDMLGATLAFVRGCREGSEEVTFTATDGRVWRMHHNQDCCERVEVAEVIGDPEDLVGAPLVEAEESTSGQDGEPRPNGYCESWTWTFYRFRTAKGSVVIRWLGESNGYYSEAVSFARAD